MSRSQGHYGADAEAQKRGQRDSPRTPANEDKVAKLRSISQKLSLAAQVPPLPGADVSAGSGDASTAIDASRKGSEEAKE